MTAVEPLSLRHRELDPGAVGRALAAAALCAGAFAAVLFGWLGMFALNQKTPFKTEFEFIATWGGLTVIGASFGAMAVLCVGGSTTGFVRGSAAARRRAATPDPAAAAADPTELGRCLVGLVAVPVAVGIVAASAACARFCTDRILDFSKPAEPAFAAAVFTGTVVGVGAAVLVAETKFTRRRVDADEPR